MAPRNQTGRASGGRNSPFHAALKVKAQARMVEIRALRAAGLTSAEIARRIGVTPSRVNRLFKLYGET